MKLVLGDMQAPLATVLEVVGAHGGLAGGRLRPEVSLISVGDHFDFGEDVAVAQEEGLRVLDWLTEHPRGQVGILLGNHDAARVIEFAGVDDAQFGAAQEVARGVLAGERAARAGGEVGTRGAREAFHRAFPRFPTPELVARDYASYTLAQGDRVRALLLAGRIRLSAIAHDTDGSTLLVTHAAVTEREVTLLRALGFLHATATDAYAVHLALDAFLDARLNRVAADWLRGGAAPLDLAPLYVPAVSGREAGGLLYHRPANDDPAARGPFDAAWEFDAERPRRYTPRVLPRSFSQVCGHTPHRRAWRELAGFRAGEEGEGAGRVRTLLLGDAPRYVGMRLPPDPSSPRVYMVDADLARCAPGSVEAFVA